MTPISRIATGATILFWLIAAAPVGGAEPDGPLWHAPAGACLTLQAEVPRDACRAFRDSSLGRVLCGEPFAPWRGELASRQRGSAFYLAAEFGFDWEHVAEVADPGALVVFALPDRSLGAAWLFAASGPPTSEPPCLAAAAANFAKRGFQETRARRSGAELRSFAPPAGGSSGPARVLFQTESLYGVANSPAAADMVLNVAPQHSLAGDSTFQAALAAAGGPVPTGNFGVFLRPLEFWELAAGPAGRGDSGVRDRLAAARRLGFDAIRAAAGRWTWNADGPSEWELHARVIAERPLRQAARLLSLEPGPIPRLPVGLEAGFSSVWALHANFAAVMQGYGNWYDEATEPGPDGVGLFDDLLAALRDDPEGVRVDLRKDVFERLGPQVASAADGDDWLLSIAAQDPARLLDTLRRYYHGDRRVTHEELWPYHVWSIGERASLFVEGESTSVVSVRALAVGHERLWVGSDPDRLRASLAASARAPQPATDPRSAELLEIMHRDPTPQLAARGLVKLGPLLAPSYAAASRAEPGPRDQRVDGGLGEPFLNNAWQWLLYGAAARPHDLSLSRLPPFAPLEQACSLSGVSVSVVADGFAIRLRTLRSAPSQ